MALRVWKLMRRVTRSLPALSSEDTRAPSLAQTAVVGEVVDLLAADEDGLVEGLEHLLSVEVPAVDLICDRDDTVDGQCGASQGRAAQGLAVGLAEASELGADLDQRAPEVDQELEEVLGGVPARRQPDRAEG